VKARLIRDQHGIPHLSAASVNELAHVQGQAVAEDRAWQLDLNRLRGEGRLAELFGPAAVEWDMFARRARIDDTAQRAYSALGSETRSFVDAFVDGVNSALGPRSAEHVVLDADPEPWHPWTPLTVFHVQQITFGSFADKLWRHHVHAVLGERGLRFFGLAGDQPAGSNAFAVGGARTRSGYPLLAGDPHRGFQAPNVYAQVHLACPGFDVVGFTFPGVPGVQHFGHTGSVAWGITNAYADYEDVFLEPGEGPDEERLVDRLQVRDADPAEFEIVVTPRGPVVIEGAERFSLRRPAEVVGDLGFESLLPLLSARDVDDVQAAFAVWVEPVNNVLAADRTGRLVQFVAGRVPVRDRRNMILPASVDEEWTGWVVLPRTREAGPDEILVSANQRVDETYDVLSAEFADPLRADRLHALLAAKDGLDPGRAADVLLDSTLDRETSAYWPPHWDGRMDVDQSGAAAYLSWRDGLIERIVASNELAPLQEETPYGGLYAGTFWLPGRIAAALRHLLRTDDDGLDIDVRLLARGAGVDVVWPRLFHPVHAFEEFGLVEGDTAARELVEAVLEAVAYPVAGDRDCVRAFQNPPGGLVCSGGPVARYVWDLGDREASAWIAPLEHDQTAAWALGELVPIITDWEALDQLDRTRRPS
jgi:penicillin G amidase